MNTFEISKAICNLSDSIMAAGVFVDNKLIAMDSKGGLPIPSDERFHKLLFQASLIADIMIGNSDFFGEAKYYSLHYQKADQLVILLSNYGMEGLLGIQLSRPYNYKETVESVHTFLQSLKQ